MSDMLYAPIGPHYSLQRRLFGDVRRNGVPQVLERVWVMVFPGLLCILYDFFGELDLEVRAEVRSCCCLPFA